MKNENFENRHFIDAEDFHQFMYSNKPTELWLDEFMTDEPYIIISSYRENKFSGFYNHQVLLTGTQDDFRWLYQANLYAKIPTNPLYTNNK